MWKQDTVGDWYFSSELGSGNIFQLKNGEWRWEAHSNNELADSLELDGWWGNEKAIERAKICLEEYLKKWEAKAKQKLQDIEKWEREYKETVSNDDFDPYNGGWKGNSWFCIRCGSKLKEIEKSVSEAAWNAMRLNHTQYYLCSNEECSHHHAPLMLHHPNSLKSPAGESYSISWVR